MPKNNCRFDKRLLTPNALELFHLHKQLTEYKTSKAKDVMIIPYKIWKEFRKVNRL